MRGLNTPGLLMLAMLAEPQMLEACWYGSAPRGLPKHYHKGLVFRHLFDRQNRPRPQWLDDIAPPRWKEPFHAGVTVRFTVLYVAHRLGLESVRAEIHDIDDYDLRFLEQLDLTFMDRYNTNLIELIPGEIRAGVLGVFQEAGILPYTERDWAELDQVRAFCFAVRDGTYRATSGRPAR